MTAAVTSEKAEKPDREPRRRGSNVSDRQIAGAASRGRKVTFQFLTANPGHEVSGYIVGMDDYHWMVASVVPESTRVQGDSPIALSLVHKSRVDLIRLHDASTINKESESAQAALVEVGQKFWRFCDSHYAGR